MALDTGWSPMQAPRPGLRLRIALTLALVCLFVVGALGATLFLASENLEDALIDQLVGHEMEYLVERHRQDPTFVPQPTASFRTYIARSPAERERLPAQLRDLGVGSHEVFEGEEELEVLVREVHGVRYYVVYEVGLYEQREQSFKMLVYVSVFAAALASLALGYWLSGILVWQITNLANKVGGLSPGAARAERLARPDQDPEVALLARAFDDYQARIEQMIRREQEFTANASHELRTPLTAIKTSCELLLADGTLTDKARARVGQINDAASRMAELIHALLFLARGQALGEVEPVALADCVAEAAEPYRAEIARKGLAFEVDVAPNAVLDLNYQALRFVLTNLIRNAVYYTDRGFVKIGYASKRLSVSDSGRGISLERLPRIFERFFSDERTSGGVGLGLSIVKGICDHYGWSIKVESVPSRGSTFSVTLS
jgi:signal transduction histidine kinase